MKCSRALYVCLLYLFSRAAVPAVAQTIPPFVCTGQSGTVVPLVAAEGLTELTEDVVVKCTGGIPTPAGQTPPLWTITINFNTTITSRNISIPGANDLSEALLLIDEPPESSIKLCFPGDSAVCQLALINA